HSIHTAAAYAWRLDVTGSGMMTMSQQLTMSIMRCYHTAPFAHLTGGVKKMHEDRRYTPVRAVKDHAKIVELVIQNIAVQRRRGFTLTLQRPKRISKLHGRLGRVEPTGGIAVPGQRDMLPNSARAGSDHCVWRAQTAREAWPYVEDSKGDHVVVAISQQLDPGADSQLTNR